MKHYIAYSISGLAILFFLSACSSGGDSGTSKPSNVQITGVSGFVSVEGGNDGHEKDASVFVIGQEAQGTATDNSGNYNLPVDVRLSGVLAHKPASGRTAKAAPVSNEYYLVVRSSDKAYGTVAPFTLLEGELKTVNPVINGVGTLSGAYTLQGAPGGDNTGIHVYVPGTSFSAWTDAAGNFSLELPSGWYPYLRAEKDGYLFSVTSGVLVLKEQTTTLDPQELAISTGVTGKVMINAGEAFTSEPGVTLFINASVDTVLMLVADNPFFFDTEWQKFETPISHSFTPGDGLRYLYVKLADANGLESSTYYDSIYLDTNPLATRVSPMSLTSTVQPLLKWKYDPPMPEPRFRVQLAWDANFNNIIEDAVVNSPSHQVAAELNNFGIYHWRVAVIDSTAFQWNWTGGWSFIVDSTSVTLTSPANALVINDVTPTHSWLQQPSASYYIMKVSQNPDLSASLDYSTTINTFTLPPLAATASTDYFWSVTHYDSGGFPGIMSDIWSYTLDTVAPSGEVSINADDPFTVDPHVVLSINATDANGVAAFLVSEDPDTPDPASLLWNSVGAATDHYLADVDFTFTSAIGNKIAYVWFRDITGNISGPVTDSIHLRPTFNIEVIDQPGSPIAMDFAPSITLDSFGLPHIAYGFSNGLGGYDLRYATYNGSTWLTNTIESGSTYSYGQAALVVNSSGFVDMEYVRTQLVGGNTYLWRVTGSYGSWDAPAQLEGNYCQSPSMALTKIGEHRRLSHICSGIGMKFWAPSKPLYKTLTTDATWWYPTSMALDSLDNAHIAYTNSPAGGIYVISPLLNGTWTTQRVAPQINYNGYDLAIDSRDKMHIAFTQSVLEGGIWKYYLGYATNDTADGTWEITSVDTEGGNTGIYPSIALDAADNVHISYHCKATGKRMYATNAYGQWGVMAVDTSPDYDRTPNTIAVDKVTGKIHMVYRGNPYSNLKYASTP